MLQTITKKGLKGFTLIELLVVIAIIGLLSTVIAAPVQNARKKAKDAKKVAELRAVATALGQYAEANGQYPATMQMLVPQYMVQLPVFASTTSAIRDRFAYATYAAAPTNGSSTQFAYHLGVHMDVYSDTLQNDADCTGATVGNLITAPACTFFNTSGSITYSYPTWVSGMVGSATNADFDGADGSNSCTAVSDCVFDLTQTY